MRDALGVKTEGLGELDEHHIFVYFRADWGELVRGHEADAILVEQPDFRGFFLITDADRGMLLIQPSPSEPKTAQTYTTERFREMVSEGLGNRIWPSKSWMSCTGSQLNLWLSISSKAGFY